MTKFVLAKKLGMTTIYEEGKAQNVTLLEVGKNVVTALRTKEKDGYQAVQIGLIKKEEEKKTKYLKKQEFQAEESESFELGQELDINQFEKGEKVEVKGISKGKGYQGVVKRHGFSGSPASHGHRHDLRAPGSIGSAFPQHVFKGKKMAGRMGSEQVTLPSLKVIEIRPEEKILAVKGAVPGNNGSVVSVMGGN